MQTIDAMCEIINNLLGIGKAMFTLRYEDVLTSVIDNLMNKGYSFDNNKKLILNSDDQGFNTVLSYESIIFAQISCDGNFKVPSLRDASYLGTHLSELQYLITTMTTIQLQESCEDSLQVLKQKFPTQELQCITLVLYMLIFYDLGLRLHTALMANIILFGIYDDIPKEA